MADLEVVKSITGVLLRQSPEEQHVVQEVLPLKYHDLGVTVAEELFREELIGVFHRQVRRRERESGLRYQVLVDPGEVKIWLEANGQEFFERIVKNISENQEPDD